MPDISIVVPVYNAEDYLCCCLESLLAQTLKDIEIICINDGSKDGSLKILKEYQKKDRRLKIIDQKNGGVSMARNKALKLASGKYVGYVDADDWVSTDFYEKLFLAAEYHKAQISGGSIECMLPQGHKSLLKLKKHKVFSKTEDKYKGFDVPRLNYVWNKIYRRDFLLKNQLLFPEGVVFEDIMFTHQSLDCCNKAVSVPDAVYFYRYNNGSLTNKMTEDRQRDFHNAIRAAQEYVLHRKIKIDVCKYPKREKRSIKILGIKVGKILVWDCVKKYYVFGVKVFQKKNMEA